jgi:hypothetical protein
MKKKLDAHEGLTLLVQRDGVLLVIIMDSAKEQELYQDDTGGMHAHIPDINDEQHDNYVGVEVNLQYGGKVQAGRIKRRARDAEGKLHGSANINPIPYLIREFTKWSSWIAVWLSIPPMISQRTCLLNAIWKGTSSD